MQTPLKRSAASTPNKSARVVRAKKAAGTKPLPAKSKTAATKGRRLLKVNDDVAKQKRELDEFEKSVAQIFKAIGGEIDGFKLGDGRSFPILTTDVKIVVGSDPSICPKADRLLPKEFLPDVVRAFNRLRLIPNGHTIHWVGRQSRIHHVCKCSFPFVPKDGRESFVPTPLQSAILGALKDRALTKQGLASEVSNGEGTVLYRHDDLKELRDLGLVKHKSRLGFFRPDAPPSNVV